MCLYTLHSKNVFFLSNLQLTYMEFEIIDGDHPCNLTIGQGIDNGRYDYMPGEHVIFSWEN